MKESVEERLEKILNQAAANEENETVFQLAKYNIEQFIKDLKIENVCWASLNCSEVSHFSAYHYYDFVLGINNQEDGNLVVISMPAIPCSEARVFGKCGPRIYVNGSSWFWYIALDYCKDDLLQQMQ